MMQYQKHNFKSIAKGDFEDKESEEAVKTANEKYADLTAFIKETLGEQLGEVRFSGRMTDSPCCLIVEGNALSPHIERLFKAMHQQIPETKRILELNPKHPLIEKLDEALKAGKKDEAAFSAKVMFSQALITEGSPLDDPAGFAKSVTELLVKSL
jgi:molecular chaperone HtpG